MNSLISGNANNTKLTKQWANNGIPQFICLLENDFVAHEEIKISCTIDLL